MSLVDLEGKYSDALKSLRENEKVRQKHEKNVHNTLLELKRTRKQVAMGIVEVIKNREGWTLQKSFKEVFLLLDGLFAEPIDKNSVTKHPWYSKIYETLRYLRQKGKTFAIFCTVLA